MTMLARFRERYGRNVGLTLILVSCVGLVTYLLAAPVRGTIVADQPGQPPLVEHSWSMSGLALLLLTCAALALTVTAVVLTARNRPSRVQHLLLAGGLLALLPSPIIATLTLAACYLLGGTGIPRNR